MHFRNESDIEMKETLNLHRQRTKWTVDIELDNKQVNLSQDVLQPVSCYCNHQIHNETLIATGTL